MNAMRIAGALVLVLGLVAFLTGGSSYANESAHAPLGPLELSAKETESVQVPQWMSLGVMVLGGAMLVLGFRRD